MFSGGFIRIKGELNEILYDALTRTEETTYTLNPESTKDYFLDVVNSGKIPVASFMAISSSGPFYGLIAGASINGSLNSLSFTYYNPVVGLVNVTVVLAETYVVYVKIYGVD